MSQAARIWIHGISGRVGQELVRLIKAAPEKYALAGGADSHGIVSSSYLEGAKHPPLPWQSETLSQSLYEADAIIDFSLPEGTQRLVRLLLKAGKTANPLLPKTLLIGTTGLKQDELAAELQELATSGWRILVCPNTSLGIAMTIKAALAVLDLGLDSGFDLSLLDIHHRYKKDRPSGTALLIDKQLKLVSRADFTMEIASQRLGGVLGEHHLSFGSDEEVITISHKALSRALFAKGALYLSAWLGRQQPEVYGWDDAWMSP